MSGSKYCPTKMSTFFLNPAEQLKVINHKLFVTKNDRVGADIYVKDLRKLMESNKLGSRIAFINYYFAKNENRGPTLCKIKEDAYNAKIIPYLSPTAMATHEATLANKKDPGPDVLASDFKNGMYTTMLLNVGTTDEPVYEKFPKIIINVFAGGFIVKNVHDGVLPRRVVVNIPNENRHFDDFYKFMSVPEGKRPSLDNEDYFACVDMIQQDLAECLKRLAFAKKKDSENVHIQNPGEITNKIFKSKRFTVDSPAALAKKVKCEMKKSSDGSMEFTPKETTPNNYYTQVRINISNQTDAKFWTTYAGGNSGFSANNMIIVAPRNNVAYRHIDSKLVGKSENGNSIMDRKTILTLNKCSKYKAPDAGHAVYAYPEAVKTFEGSEHEMYTEFSDCGRQILNMVVSPTLFINDVNFCPSFEIAPFRDLFITRIDKDYFSKRNKIITDEDVDLEDESNFTALDGINEVECFEEDEDEDE